MLKSLRTPALLPVLALLIGSHGFAADNTVKLRVADARMDGGAVTAHTLAVVMGTKDADKNWNGKVLMEVRKVGEQKWRPHVEMFRHRNGMPRLCQPFAGMVWGLEPDTEYEIKLTPKDPDGVEGKAEQIVRGRTRKLPAVVKAEAGNTVNVASLADLGKALKAAKPGQVILLKKGSYKGNVGIAGVKGTQDKPIVLRGEDRQTTIINGSVTVGSCEHVQIEDLTIQGSNYGINLNRRNSAVTIRGCIILKVNQGIFAKQGHSYLYIRNNAIIGNNKYGDTRSSTWNDEGIVLSGNGHEVCYNTLAGFGDALGFTHKSGGLSNKGVDIHHNLVLWTGDDAVEMDFTLRSNVAHHNLFTNCASGVSFQMVLCGPAYAFRNVMYNLQRGPYKIKPERSENDGVFIFNNTSIKAGKAYVNWSVEADGAGIVNNLFVGTKDKLLVQTGGKKGFRRLVMDYNAWSYDGGFSMRNHRAKNFKDWKEKCKQGNHDVLLAGEKIFQTLPLDFDKQGFGYYRVHKGVNFSLDEKSSAVDAGTEIPGVTDGFSGKAPDIGAYERGAKPEKYGVDYEFKMPAEHNYKQGTKAEVFKKKK